MRKNLPVSGHEIDYPSDRTIISTTDLKGVITYVNRDFIEISGFSQDELIGQPHNLIRHPDMPAIAFQHLWDTVKSGRPWQGLVKNRAKNGDHYWVQAFVIPVERNGEVVGYQSVRFKPTKESIQSADKLYREINDGTRTSLPKTLGSANHSVFNRIRLLLLLGVSGGVAAFASVVGGIPSVAAPLGIGALLSLSGAVWLFERRVANRIRTIKSCLRSLSSGRLSHAMPELSLDEVGEVMQHLKMLQARYRTVIGMFDEAVERLASTGNQLTSAADETTQKMRQQSKESDQVAAAVAEMASTAAEIGQNTSLAAREADHAAETTRQGGDMLGGVIQQVSAMTNQVGEVANVVRSLDERSTSVARVVRVINDIAEKTNLLALNAAIEAARAGDQGRGFAVVADEVRKLAEQTTQATGQIDAVIKALLEDAAQAGRTMDGTTAAVNDTAARAKTVRDMFVEIQAAVGEITGRAAQIAAAAQQQTEVSDEIARNMQRVADMSEQTLVQTESVSTGSASIGQVIDGLQQLVGQFDLGNSRRLDLSRAKSAHLAWKTRIKAYLEGKESLTKEQAVSHQHCVLGKWFYGEGISRFGHFAEMRDLEIPHERLHALIREIIQHQERGEVRQANAKAAQIDSLSRQIVDLLERIEVKVNAGGKYHE